MGTRAVILCQWNDRWFLAQKAQPSTPSCSLAAGDWQGLEELEFRCEQRGYIPPGESDFIRWQTWHRFMPTMDGITFYPKLLYHGTLVWPSAWHRESAEPILMCEAMPGWDGYKLDETFAEKIGMRGQMQTEGLSLVSDGWDASEKGVFRKYLHVDEIEKIEGPQPEGTF